MSNSKQLKVIFSEVYARATPIPNEMDIEMASAKGPRGRKETDSVKVMAQVIAKTLQRDFREQHYDIMYQKQEFNVYDGKRWIPLGQDLLEFCLPLYLIAAGMEEPKANDIALIDRIIKQMKRSLIEFDDYFDPPDIVLANCENGTLILNDMDQCEIREHNPCDGLFYCTPFDYDPTVLCPKFEQFLKDTLESDDIDVIQEYFGTVLSQMIKHEKVLCCVGDGANGKSTLYNMIRCVLGVENVSGYSLQSLCTEDSKSRYNIQYKLLNFCSDCSSKIANNGYFKQLASGEPVEARLLYRNAVTIERYAKIAFNTNALPTSADSSKGFLRRLLPVYFDRSIPVDKQDPHIAEKIVSEEASGILNWMVEGLLRFIANGNKFSKSDTMESNMKDYEEEFDSVANFMITEPFKPGTAKSCTLQEAHQYYKTACKKAGFKSPLGRNLFKNRLVSNGFDVHKPSNNSAYMVDYEQ